MKVYTHPSLVFTRRLKPKEEAEYCDVLKRGKALAGNNGKSILVLPTSSLPQGAGSNTGVGNILDKEALEFFDFAKKYWGINCIQDLPNGNFSLKNGACKPYSGSSFDLGSQIINLKLLVGNLINQEDYDSVIRSNKITDSINYENVIQEGSPADRVLRKAYENLIKSDTEEKKKLLKELSIFESENKSWLEPKSIFHALEKKYNTNNYHSWEHIDCNLYDPEIKPEQRAERIAKIKKEYPFDTGFYNFKQFLADKHLKLAREELNKRGIQLCGDLPCGFSRDEVWMRPKAFYPNTQIYWGLPALNLETDDGINFLKEKVQLYAKRYDNIRVDAGWIYINQPIKKVNGCEADLKKYYQDKILKEIEESFKSVKGEKYNPEDIMYELITSSKDFRSCDSNLKLLPILEARNKIYTTDNLEWFWGSADCFIKKGWDKNFFTVGTANHDIKPMKVEYAQNQSKKAYQTEILSKLLKIPKEKLSDLKEFIKAKFAEPMKAKHNFFFFMDALNLDGLYKDHSDQTKDYRVKISSGYQEAYFKALENGEGYNPMDALEKAFLAEGLDKKEPDLYRKIVKYKKILESPEKNIIKSRIIKGTIGALAVCLASLAAVKYHSYKKEKPAEVQPV